MFFFLTVLPHELVKLVQRLGVLRRRVVHWVLLRTHMLRVGRWCFTAVAAHKRWQNGGIIHAPIQSPEQCSHSLRDDGRILAAASVCTSPRNRKGLHLQHFHSFSVAFLVHVLSNCSVHCVLPTVAEVTVLVLMVLQEVMNWPQPQCSARSRSPAGTLAMSISTTVAANPTAVRVHLFAPFADQKRKYIYITDRGEINFHLLMNERSKKSGFIYNIFQ